MGESESENTVFREVLQNVISLPAGSNADKDSLGYKVQKLKESLNSRFIEREISVMAALTGLFTNEPVVFIGPVGTAKTNLIEELGKAINGKYFYYLLHNFTDPDELLGPLNVKKYRDEGIFERIKEGGLQEAEIAFLDEPFKASSAIRNMLLDIMLNKRVKGQAGQEKLPMVGLYMAANELPSESEDAAFYDRLVIRDFVSYVSKASRPQLLLRDGGLDKETTAENRNIMSVAEVKQAQAEVSKRYEAAKQDAKLVEAWATAIGLTENAGITVSDRTKKKIMKVAAAISVIWNEPKVTTEHLAAALYLTAPREREDTSKIEDVVAKARLSPTYDNAIKLFNVAQELLNVYTEAKQQEGLPTFKATFERLNSTYDQAKLLVDEHKADSKLGFIMEPLSDLVERTAIYSKAKAKQLEKEEKDKAAAQSQQKSTRSYESVDVDVSSREGIGPSRSLSRGV